MSSSPTNKHNSDSNLQNFTNYNNKQTEIKKIDLVTSYTEGSEKTNSFSTISNLLDNLNKNSLNLFYQNSTSLFKKKIDDLNLKFYLETEKYLTNKKKDYNCQNTLFIILFKQISLYIEEIERLNLIIQEKKFEPKNIKERTDEIIKKQKEFETKELLIKTLKDSKAHVESKLLEVIGNEDKLKMENEKLKKENEYLKDRLISLLPKSQPLTAQIELLHQNTKTSPFNASNPAKSIEKTSINKKRNYSDSNPSTHKKNNNSATGISKVKQKKELGIIKSVKEKLIRNSSNEYKIKSSGNIASSPRTCHSPAISPGHIKETKNSNTNLDYVDRFMQDLKLDFLNDTYHHSSSKEIGHVKTEVIVSDLEDYYNNNTTKINAMVENSLCNNSNTHLPSVNSKNKSTVMNQGTHKTQIKKFGATFHPITNNKNKKTQIKV